MLTGAAAGPLLVKPATAFGAQANSAVAFGIIGTGGRGRYVGGLMAKQLGRVPIPGAEVEVGGLRLVAEGPAGRRNQVATIVASRVEQSSEPAPGHPAAARRQQPA